MNYYIIDNKIKGFAKLFGADYNHQKLTPTQKTFYEANPTASVNEVLAKKLNTPYEPTLQDLKNQKNGSFESDFYMTIENGYYDATEDITLAIRDEDRTAFSQLLTMINLAEDLQQSVPDQTIADIEGVSRTLTVLELKGLLLRYGFYYQTAWGTLVHKKNLVKNATTEEELNAII